MCPSHAVLVFQLNGKKEDEKESAHKELREAVRELSQGLARPTTSSSTSNLKDMDASPLSELEVDQLEELARAHYEGEVDGSEASKPRLWRSGPRRQKGDVSCHSTSWPSAIARGTELPKMQIKLSR